MSFELDKIDNVEIYSFDTVEILRQFVSQNNLLEYDLKEEAEAESSPRKYNTRSRPSPDQSGLSGSLSCYLNKLDSDHTLLDPAGEDLISASTSKRHTRSQAGRVTLPECGKVYCRLGCICEQSNSSNKTNGGKHCGRFECMFECNCARKLRSSTRAKSDTDTKKVSSSASVCSGSSSNSSACLRKSKRPRTKVNYSSYSKTGSCSDTSADLLPKSSKFRAYSETLALDRTRNLKLEILSKNYDSIRMKILDFIKKMCSHLALFEWKEVGFGFEKSVNVRLMNRPLVARVTKFKAKEPARLSELDAFCTKFPMVCVHLFRFKKTCANKENKEPQSKVAKALPRLLCRKADRAHKCGSKKFFTNVESLLENLATKHEKISEGLSNLRDYAKIELFSEEKEFLNNNDSKLLYDPFSDESLVVDCYKRVGCRSLVDSVAETLNDMISVVCTHKENSEKKCELTLPIESQMPKRRPNVIILRRNLHKGSPQLVPQGKTFVKILNTTEGNRVSIINKLVDEKPVFKVAFDQSKSTLATIKQNLLSSSAHNIKRKRKQDLSFLASKIIHINRVEAPLNQPQNAKPFVVSRTLFSKKFRSNSETQNLNSSSLIKKEPEILFSDPTSYSQNFLTLYNEINISGESLEESSENSLNHEQQMSPSSMLKLNIPCSSTFNSDRSRKFSISSNSSSFKYNRSFEEDELMDSDVENDDDDDDYFSKSSDSTKSGGQKNISLNLHSVRERQRRLRLKNLLTKLKLALYDADENTSSVKINNSNFKHSKQATLAEAVDSIKKLETQGQKLEYEFENVKKQNFILQKRLELLKSQQWTK